MPYGRFSEDGREYIIERPDTPRPWINYLCNRDGRYVSLLSANAGGYAYIDCPKDGRITRWRYNALPDDRPGRYLYLKSADDRDIWTLSWQPTARDIRDYRVRHGAGYTVFECSRHDIRAEATVFVPLNDTLEIWDVVLRNTAGVRQELEVYAVAEMCLGHALIDLINKPNDQHFNRLWFDRCANTLFSTKTYWVTGTSANRQENKAWDKVAFMASSLPVEGYAGERETFYGPYRSESNPLAVETGKPASVPVSSGNLVSCLQQRVSLAAGETRRFHILLGVAPKAPGRTVNGGRESFQHCGWEAHCAALVDKYQAAGHVARALQEVRQYWADYMAHVRVRTPGRYLNTYVNFWNPLQAKVTYVNARNASYFHWGVTRGIGFRDSLQDTLGVVIAEPEKARKRILQVAGYQRSDGSCMHLFHPVSGEGEFTGHRDDPLWLITAVWFYAAETGDLNVLDAAAPFHEKPQAATLGDHLMASVRFIEAHLGPNGIPTFGRGDWNDTLDYVGGDEGGGESVWAGMFYAYNLLRLAELFDRHERWRPETAWLRARYARIRDALNTHAWDGDWYIRAVCANGRVLGSRRCASGRIYLNPQTWAVLSGVADGERGVRAMDAVREHLDTAFGPKLLAPAYHEIDPEIGLITRCVWGKKENGAVFNHTTTWAIMAECLLGRGRRARELYDSLVPAAFDADRYEVEPYVYAQYTTSDEHETFGQGSHSWLSGTAAWMFRAVLDGMLGVRVTLDGIRLEPCIDPEWDAYEVTRVFRNTTYKIRVRNPESLSSGLAQLCVDRAAADPEACLPVRPGTVVRVEATVGRDGLRRP